eukprot:86042-Chlamydomonas_euryale.AAC.1
MAGQRQRQHAPAGAWACQRHGHHAVATSPTEGAWSNLTHLAGNMHWRPKRTYRCLCAAGVCCRLR